MNEKQNDSDNAVIWRAMCASYWAIEFMSIVYAIFFIQYSQHNRNKL